MKVVIPGGTGQIGGILARSLAAEGHQVVLLTRSPKAANHVAWDGRTLGPWAQEVDGCDVVINLAGRTVDCRYTEQNLGEMMRSRVDSTRIVGEAIGAARKPPGVWLQMSTATLYAHRFDAANDEETGIIGGDEKGVPQYWRRSIDIAKAWEATALGAHTPQTRTVLMRTAMVMSPDRGGVFDVLSKMTRLGLGGPMGGGRQYVSWIHDVDLVAAIRKLISDSDIEGAVNLASPSPLPQRAFMSALRTAWGVPFGLPAAKWMLEIGAFFMGTDTELLLKSRRVVPARLLAKNFVFRYPTWPEAAADLVGRRRARAPMTMVRNRDENQQLTYAKNEHADNGR